MKNAIQLALALILIVIALGALGFMFVAESKAVYEFQRQYVIVSGIFLIVTGLLVYLFHSIKRGE